MALTPLQVDILRLLAERRKRVGESYVAGGVALGYLAWAACGKDPGFSPEFVVEAASRQHYPQAEINLLAFAGHPPSAAQLGAAWKIAVEEARKIVRLLPPEVVGHCVMDTDGNVYSEDVERLGIALSEGGLQFHPGTIGGVWPMLKSS